MIKQQDKQRKQDLGIFYTPQEVVDFIFEILKIWEKNQVARWKTRDGKQKYPSVIDPAVGEGGFLKVALEKKFTKPDWIFGLDIDEKAVNKWKEINLLKEFGGKDKDLEAHFFHQNGLEKIKWEQHRNKYKYKLKQIDISNQQFDTVVGNPPYGGVGLGETELIDDLIAQLAKFEILPKSTKDDLNTANTQEDLFGSDKSFSLKPDAKQRIKSFPIEILFLERFIQLAKPGGWIAIIIPDGILTNSNSHYVREFISNKTKIEAIVSLPRNTFKIVGTTAKTSILFLRKLKENEKPSQDYTVFLSSTEDIDKTNFQKILDSYQKFYNEEINMDKSELIQITKDQNGREIAMVRVDKNLKSLLNCCTSPRMTWSRFDVKYWHPKYENIINKMKKYNLKCFGSYIIFFKQGDIPRVSKGEKGSGVKINMQNRLIEGTSLHDTGIDYEQFQPVSDIFWQRMKEAQIHKDDLIFTRTGASLGQTVVITMEPSRIYLINGALDIIRFNKQLNPYFGAVFLMSLFGKIQTERIENGVGQPNLSEDELYQIYIPEIPEQFQKDIETEYKKMSVYHTKAMEAKKNGDNNEFKINLEIAEKMLKDLIARTEAVILGEREDII